MNKINKELRLTKLILGILIVVYALTPLAIAADNETNDDLLTDLNIGNAKAGYESLPNSTKKDAALIGGIVSFILVFVLLVVLMIHGIGGAASTVVGEAGRKNKHTEGILTIIGIAFLVGIGIAFVVYRFLS